MSKKIIFIKKSKPSNILVFSKYNLKKPEINYLTRNGYVTKFEGRDEIKKTIK